MSRIFGYSSKGIPSIEIVGFKSKNKVLKEKIIYLTKLFKIKTPLRRFVICLDDNESKYLEEVKEFELPVLLILLALSGNIKITDLQNCLSLGSFDTYGNLSELNISSRNVQEIKKKQYTLIGSYQLQPNQGLRLISFESIRID